MTDKPPENYNNSRKMTFIQGVALFIFGLLFGVMGSLYPTLAARFSLPEHRGTAMGYAGQFWGLGQLVVPIAFGFIAAAVGIPDAIRIGGVILVVWSVAVIGLYPWLTKHGAPARSGEANGERIRGTR